MSPYTFVPLMPKCIVIMHGSRATAIRVKPYDSNESEDIPIRSGVGYQTHSRTVGAVREIDHKVVTDPYRRGRVMTAAISINSLYNAETFTSAPPVRAHEGLIPTITMLELVDLVFKRCISFNFYRLPASAYALAQDDDPFAAGKIDDFVNVSGRGAS